MSSSNDDQAGIPLIEDLSDSPEPHTQKSTKRKRPTDPDPDDTLTKNEAKKARRKAKKHHDDDDDDTTLDPILGINRAIAHMDSRLLADHIAQRTQRFQPDLSPVEADDWRIPESAITDTTAFAEPRTTANLPAFLETFAGKKKTTTTTTTTTTTKKKKDGGLASAPSKFNGSPHSLVVCGAGLRAADVTRVVRKFQTKEAKVAKLFAKHIKLKEAREELKRTRVNFGVGTPQRIMDLIEDGALRTDELERIVVDASHIDQKKRGVLDMKELQVPLVKLLTSEGIKGRYGKGEGKIELLFY